MHLWAHDPWSAQHGSTSNEKCTAVNIYVKSEKRISPCLSHLFQIVWNLCPGWLLCLMRKKGFCSLLTSLILGLYYKLNWPKRASAVYWLLGTLLYPWFGICHATSDPAPAPSLRQHLKMAPFPLHSTPVNNSGVSKSRYCGISILIKYSNFSRFYKKNGSIL